jgi:hypothetical protein
MFIIHLILAILGISSPFWIPFLLCTIADYIAIKDTPAIRFSSLKSLYFVNPERWELTDALVVYHARKGKEIYMRIPFHELIAYAYWKQTIKRQRDQLQNDKQIALVLQDVRKDLDALQQKADAMILSGQNNLESIIQEMRTHK